MLGGLRGRIVGALLLSAAATLGIAALLLLAPLESRLRRDEITNVGRDLRTARTVLDRLDARDLRAPSPRLRAAAKRMKARVGGEIVIVGPGQRVLAATDIERGERFPEAALALARGRTVHVTSTTGSLATVHVAVPAGAKKDVAVVAVKRLNDAREAVGVVRRAFLGAAAISLAIALVLGLLVASRLVRRLRRLRDTALRVAEVGPVLELRGDKARDEVGDLTRALVTMQNRLREQEGARRAFVATASHELRTPLTSLQVMLDLLRDDLDGERPDIQDARLQVGRADEQAERLASLAGDLLDLSRLDDGVAPRAELVDLVEVTRAVIAELSDRQSAPGAPIRLDGDAAWAVGDPGSIAQILRILLDNARRHGPAGGAIAVTITRGSRGEPTTVTVADDGPPLARADRERIFERFERGPSTSDAPGFGLGLAIGRELATRMHGSLTLDDLGDGADAYVRFRLALPPAPGSGV